MKIKCINSIITNNSSGVKIHLVVGNDYEVDLETYEQIKEHVEIVSTDKKEAKEMFAKKIEEKKESKPWPMRLLKT